MRQKSYFGVIWLLVLAESNLPINPLISVVLQKVCFFFFLVSESRNSAHMLVALGLAFFNYSHGTHLFLFLYPFASETSTADEFPSLDCDFDTVKIKTSDNESGERD